MSFDDVTLSVDAASVTGRQKCLCTAPATVRANPRADTEIPAPHIDLDGYAILETDAGAHVVWHPAPPQGHYGISANCD